uniref:Jade protein n=2 Tax=Phlebobranchia TaxID=7716 RepID=A0A6F9DES4_9ASCI|nr:Jade protein [Phallusia mammillata]
MTSTLAMTSGRRQSKLRLPNNILSCGDDFNLTGGSSGSPLITPNDTTDPLDKVFHLDSMDGDDNNNNNRSATAVLSKLLDGKDLFNDVEASPSPPCQDSDSFVPSKSASSRLSIQKLSASQRKNNRPPTNRHKPAEVFRKDLISAMKIPDTSQLLSEEYWVMQDSWKIEWEKGVQVPVNAKSIPTKNVRIVPKEMQGGFRMPRKMLKSSPEPGDKDMVDLNVLADSACRYDLDEMDVLWLNEINEERSLRGLMSLDEFSMEQIMEELETQCHENMQVAIQTKEGLGIEYDEDVVCDVCRMPDCEEGNEMVFCDGCNLCVHQACYGILKVPEGNWLCRPCSLGIRGSAVCILCDRKGGAMKSTRSGNKWAHVSCALWIPEISIADPERMEPITKVSHVPASRWALLCSICKDRVGACIQCSVKHCVTAYHVTCAVEEKLDMIADCTDESAEDAVIFRSFCKKHSKNRTESISDQEKDEEEKRNLRQKRIMELEEDFFTLVKDEAVANALSVPIETVQEVMAYWKLKRKVNFDRALITPKHEEGTALAEAAETNLQRRLRMFTHLRQDLERVRNLCYMIGRREKTKRSSVKNMESVFLTQMKLLERRMCHDTTFNTQRMANNLTKFGKPEVCELAKKEWKFLSKHPEWMPMDVLADKAPADTRDNTNTELKAQVDTSTIPPASDHKVAPDVNKLPTSRHKNGLHRKAFLTACQRRESLGLKRAPTQTETPEVAQEVTKPRAETRKRSLRSNSDSDFESENKVPFSPTDTRLSKRTKTWSVWRTKAAGVSPSAFTVKTEKVEEEKTPDSKSRTSRHRPSRLGTRASSITDNERSAQLSDSALPNATVKPPKPDLVIKWDSDKVDEPEMTTQKGKNSLPNGQVPKCTKPDSNGNAKHTVQSRKPISAVKSSPGSVETRSTSQKIGRRLPGRRAAAEAKNVPGALAQSCDSDVSAEDHKASVSREQGLRKSHTSPRKDQGGSEKEVLVDKKNIPRPRLRSGKRDDDEDGGYRGDMDESDSETLGASPSRHKHPHPASKRVSHAMQKRSAQKHSDTADSSDYKSLNEYDKTSMAKRRRLRSLHRLQKPDACEVRFKGYKDVLDDPQATPPSRLSGQAASSEMTLQSDTTNDQSHRWSKNESAVGDACDEDVAVDEQRSIAGGPTLSTSNAAHPPSYTPAGSNQGYQVPMSFYNPPPGYYPNSQVVLPPDIYYSNVYSRSGWTLTPKQKSIYAQQFAAQALHQAALQHSAQTAASLPPDNSSPPLPDSTLSPESNQIPNSIATQASLNPSFDPQNPLVMNTVAQNSQEQGFSGASVSQTQVQYQDSQPPPGEESPVSRKSHKKKKSKKSKRKKKKKRKRRESMMSAQKSNTASEAQSGSSDEYCVEYCSVLPNPVEDETAATPTSEESPAHVSDNDDVPVANVPSREVELSQSGNDTLNASNTSANTGSFVSSEQASPVKQGGLLLKIDRKRLIVTQESESEDESESSAASSSGNESGTLADSSNKTAPYVSPLKLKLSIQKSDRALRSGLMPRCYEILGEDNPPLDGERESDNESQSLINTTEKTERPTRAQAALRRLGLLSDDAKPQQPEKRAVLRIPTVSNSSPTRITAPANDPPALPVPRRKRGRPRKTVAPKHEVESKASVEHSTPVAVTTTRSASTDTRGTFTSNVHATPPHRVRSHSDVILPDVTSPVGGGVAQPERHWKKRKVIEHETSVTVEPKPPPDNSAAIESSVVNPSSSSNYTSPTEPKPLETPTTISSAREMPGPTPPSGVQKMDTEVSDIKHSHEPDVHENATKWPETTASPVTVKSPRVSTGNDTQQRPTKANRRKTSADQPNDARKSSGKSFQSSRTVVDGLPPVSPYRFTIANTHQQKMCKSGTPAPGTVPRDAAFNLVRAKRKHESGGKPAVKKTSSSKDDPYEFADFGS